MAVSSKTARLQGLRVLIRTGAWTSVSVECCVLCIGLCDGLITRAEECCGVCMCLSVIEERHTGGFGPLGQSSRERERERESETDRQTDGWTDGWMDGWMDGSMDR